MKALSRVIALAWIVLAPLAASAQIPAAAERQLAEARHKATIDGDLKGAIEAYRKIVAGAGDNRALAARALIELAECHEKLGEAEAANIYNRVVRDFAEQTQEAAIARAKLSAGRGGKAVSARQAWSGVRVDFSGTVSADGRLLSFVDWSTGNLHLLDLDTGRDRPLTTEGTWYRTPIQFAQESALSPDGRQVAYAWQKGSHFELRLVSTAANGRPRTLLADETIASLHPYAWSPDGRWIAVQVRRTDGSAHIGLVSVTTGTLRILRSGTTTSLRLYFSPDGTHLAFDLPGKDSRERDVFVLRVADGTEIPAVVHPGTDFAAGWSPDGGSLLFASERSGSRGLWHLRWTNGQPAGEPALLKSDMSMAAPPLGLTRGGALFYGTTLSSRDVAVARIDLQSGAVTSQPTRPVSRFVGGNTSPDWSPDGRFLAYISSRQGPVLGIRNMATGETRELRPALTRINSPRWSPDGRSLAIVGGDVNDRWGIYRVDAMTGEASILVEVPRRNAPYAHDWTPDGKSIVYRVFDGSTQAAVQTDLASGVTREISRGGMATLQLSPDGRSLATASESGLAIVPLDTGQPRQVPAQGLTWPFMVMAWTPDSRQVLVATWPEQADVPNAKTDLWLVGVADGSRRKVGLDLQIVGSPGARFNRTSNELALTVDQTRREVWVVENFLPAKNK